MEEAKEVNKKKNDRALPVIGTYTFCSTGSVLVHAIEGDRVLASVNGRDANWREITEEWNEEECEWESGFYISPGSFFVPFSQVMRTDL